MQIDTSFLKHLLKRYKSYYALALLLSCIVIITSIIQPKVMMHIIDNGIEARNLPVLLMALVLYFSIYMVTIVIRPVVQYTYFSLGRKVIYSIRTTIINHLFTLSGKFYTNIDSGDMIHLAQYDIATTEKLFTSMIPSLLTQSVIAIGYIIILSTVKVELLLIILLLESGNFLYQKNLAKKLESMNQEFIDINRASYSNMNEIFNNIKSIVVLRASSIFLRTYHTKQQQGIAAQKKIHRSHLIGNSITWIMNLIGNVCIFGLGGWYIVNDQLTIGGLMIFISYSGSLLAPLELFYQSYIQYRQALVSIRRINNFLHEEGVPKLEKDEAISVSHIDQIKLQDISFSYEEGVEILKNASMEFRSQSRTAIVGKSGSGKSTILNLIVRLWDPNKGKVLINNKDIKHIDIMELRDHIAYIPQDTFLFNDTIRNNITLGKPVKFERLSYCLELVEAQFAFDLPQGLDTVVGEQGAKLSGGQKQKIALARALLLQKQVLILDEFTASIDQPTAHRILKRVEKTSQKMIVILISHNMNQTVNCDRVYTIKDGVVFSDR